MAPGHKAQGGSVWMKKDEEEQGREAPYSSGFQYMKPMPSPVPAAVRQQGT